MRTRADPSQVWARSFSTENHQVAGSHQLHSSSLGYELIHCKAVLPCSIPPMDVKRLIYAGFGWSFTSFKSNPVVKGSMYLDHVVLLVRQGLPW